MAQEHRVENTELSTGDRDTHLRTGRHITCGFTQGSACILKRKVVGNASGDPVGGAVVKTRWRQPVRFLVMKPKSTKSLGKGFQNTRCTCLGSGTTWESLFILILHGHWATSYDTGDSLELIINRTPWPGSVGQAKGLVPSQDSWQNRDVILAVLEP